MTKSVVAVIDGTKGFSTSLMSSTRETLERFSKEVVLFISPTYPLLAWFVVGGGIILLSRHWRHRFGPYHLIGMVFILPIVTLALSRHSVLSHFFLFISPGIFLTSAMFIDWLWKKRSILGLFVLIGLAIINLTALPRLKPWGITIGTEKKIIDFIYNEAHGKPFRYEAFTFPYFWKDAWEYMFLWYGKPKYGYIPVEKGVDRVYFIWEEENTPNQRYWFNEHVNLYGDVVSSTKVEHVYAERREKRTGR